jgi:transcriptional regulator with XRE-family HTH domain
MSFDQTFSDLRARRRIPMRLFEERTGISTSYIHGIEKEKLLPSREKLEQLAAVFVEVAEEQEAADPQADARRLFRERARTAYIERLGYEPDLAEILLSLDDLDAKRRADITQPLVEAIGLFETLESQERRAVKRLLHKLVSFLEEREGDERQRAASIFDEFLEDALKVVESELAEDRTIEEDRKPEAEPASEAGSEEAGREPEPGLERSA